MAVKGAPHVLVVAGSDSSGGAGIARDIETIAAMGLRTCLAVTAVTVQTHDSVGDIVTVEPAHIEAQMRAALAANNVKAIKVGMLGGAGAVDVVAKVIQEHPEIPAVLDPVLRSTSGKPLLAAKARESLKHDLMPVCALVTPNLDELAVLSGMTRTRNVEGCNAQAEALLRAGCGAVLAKGGHDAGEHAIDMLHRSGRPSLGFESPRVKGKMRGTGCVLSSAITAGLAQGNSLIESIATAKRYVYNAILKTAQTPERC